MADNKISDSAWTLLTSFHEANEAVVKHMAEAQERNLVAAQERSVQYTQRFFTEGMEVLKANQAAAQSLQAAQERNMQYVQRFFTQGIEALKSQTDSMRALMQDLEQQLNKQREALQTLTRAPMEMTLDILYAPLAAYQKALDAAETVTRESFKQVQQMTDQMWQAAPPPDEPHGK